MSKDIYAGESNDLSVKNTVNKSMGNPIANDLSLLTYYTDSSKYSEIEIFDNSYSLALELMGGDKLLKPAALANSVIIRKTTTSGLYKLILKGSDLSLKIEYIDESQLLNNRNYCKGTLSKINSDMFELTYFDTDDEIIIEHYSKEEVINFMRKNKLIFQN